MLLQQVLSLYTESWGLFFGLIFIAFVMLAPEGIWGLLHRRRGRGA
jgi:branched-chain amino acid transport system permease protein